MNRRKVLASLSLVVTVGLLASCADDAKKTISKTEFLTKGNAICTTFNGKMTEAEASIATDDDVLTFYTETFVPELRGVLRSIENLGFPAGDATLLQGLIDDTDGVLDGVAADPAAFVASGTNPFAPINDQLHTYGLTACGED